MRYIFTYYKFTYLKCTIFISSSKFYNLATVYLLFKNTFLTLEIFLVSFCSPPLPIPTQPQANTVLLSISIDFPFLEIPLKCKDT